MYEFIFGRGKRLSLASTVASKLESWSSEDFGHRIGVQYRYGTVPDIVGEGCRELGMGLLAVQCWNPSYCTNELVRRIAASLERSKPHDDTSTSNLFIYSPVQTLFAVMLAGI